MNFASDNWAGASANVLAALGAANGTLPAYGADPVTARAKALLEEALGGSAAFAFVATGTAANALCLSLAARAGGVVLCHEGAHITVDEGGAPEALSGGLKFVTIAGRAGKIAPDALEEAFARFPKGVVHHGRVVAVSITNLTELGTLYRPGEVRALADIAHRHGALLHCDGARLFNAAASAGVSPIALTREAGVDLLSFGMTKCGALCAEVAVAFDPALGEDLAFAQKRIGQLLSKQRLYAAQVAALLEGGHGQDLAARANGLAARLGAGLVGLEGTRLIAPVEGNEVFIAMPKEMAARLEEGGVKFYDWPVFALQPEERPGPGERLLRLVTHHALGTEDVERLIALAAG